MGEKLSTSLAKALFAEFFCTLFFVYLATSAVTSGCRTGDSARESGNNPNLTGNVIPGNCFLASSNLLGIAIAFGGSIAIFVYAAASFSGGHLNPAVSVAFWMSGKISAMRAILYVVFQCLGACTGSALVLAIDHIGYMAALGASNRLNTGINPANAWAAETILTCVLVFTVFAATDTTRSSSSGHLSVLAPFAIGLAVLLAHLVAVPIDGCSINPARSFGVAAVSHDWTHQWIFWVGPIGGGICAAAIYGILSAQNDKDEKLQSDLEEQQPTLRMPKYAGAAGVSVKQTNRAVAGAGVV
ncbi:hypothetical protein WJX75_004416 [Coccomyxa subellipsoidea]|uniref:Aquaporin n=1 Tax=Coccomyxa subellipsoidea TaxID=248742 RepID=A0ABR2YEX1_9CHLO